MDEQHGRTPVREMTLLLEGMPCGAVICDPDGHYLYVNPGARKIFGVELLEGTTVHDCHPAELHDKVDASLEAFRKGEKRLTVDRFRSGDRTVRETMLGLWYEGRYLGMACIYEDITGLIGEEKEEEL